MKRLHKFIISSFLGPFCLTFFIVIFILLMQFLWKYIEDLAGKGLSFSILAELMLYVSSSMVPLALPLAILLASLMTMGNLGENYELTAMKASGISLPRIMSSLVIFSLILASFAFFFANYILPITNKKMMSLLWDITKQKPELQIKEGIFYNGLENYSIRIGKKDYKTNLLHQIKIYNHIKGNGNTDFTIADSGYMRMTSDKKYLFVTLFNGYNYSEDDDSPQSKRRHQSQNTHPFRRDKFAKEEFRIPMAGFGLKRTDENLFSSNQRMLSLRQLNHFVDSLNRDIRFYSTSLYKAMLANNLMRYKPEIMRITKDTSRKDTIRPQPFETTFINLSASDRNNIINSALSYARDTKSTISSSVMSLNETQFRMHKYEIEWWRKFTLSAGCLIFFFIGAPLGAIIRKGGLGMPVVISVLFFVIYYVISITGEKFAREGMLTAALGMWLSTIILLPTGVFLTRKATRDSTILNIDTYINYWKKAIASISKKKRVKTMA